MKISGIFLALLMLTGCTSVKHVTPETFRADLQNVNTLYWCEYIGQADGKAFLLWKKAPLIGKEWIHNVHFTEADKLDPAFLKRLEASRKPK